MTFSRFLITQLSQPSPGDRQDELAFPKAGLFPKLAMKNKSRRVANGQYAV
ncbi:hypothetical protein AM1_B0071 (plasmid) [Acaryochloris marina MBIC11017]|uniref:Uncharacterized protein n=1 Tax=Acaryochloris marina (strain MBIC 11017) TaxID=329726 RepID=A8ZM28_ACAM1|nr:hypothetical protein AM1_B0071 [Acaryochloris marina MBIC11017]